MEKAKENPSPKSPLLAATLNFIFFGAGYLYLGKKKTFGAILIAAFVVMTIEYFLGTLSHLGNLINTHTISMTVLALALAYDAYALGKNDIKNKDIIPH